MTIGLTDTVEYNGVTYTTGETISHVWNDGSSHDLIIDSIISLNGDTLIQYHYVEEYLKRIEVTGNDGSTYVTNKVVLPVQKFQQIFNITGVVF